MCLVVVSASHRAKFGTLFGISAFTGMTLGMITQSNAHAWAAISTHHHHEESKKIPSEFSSWPIRLDGRIGIIKLFNAMDGAGSQQSQRQGSKSSYRDHHGARYFNVVVDEDASQSKTFASVTIHPLSLFSQTHPPKFANTIG
jgi:hypothetical protein